MKKIALFCAAVAASLGMNAQDTALTAEMWHQWTGWGADATIIEDADPGVEYNIGKDLGEGSMVIGQPVCNGDVYADLSDYAGISGVATPGVSVRFFFNRDGLQGPGIDKSVDVDADGNFTFMFRELGEVEFVHLNFIKILEQWRGGKWPEGLEKAVVKSMSLIPKESSEDPDDPEVPADPLAISGAWFHQWDGYGADATVTNENPDVENQIGKEVGAGATILGTGSVWGDIYADLTQYAGIEAEGTPGAPVRLLFNRPTQDQGIIECVPVFDEDGKFTFLFTEVMDGDVPAAFIHLNAVKAPWGFPEGISSCTITKFNVIPKESSEDPLAIGGAWFHQWDGYGADATVTNENPDVEDQIGREVGAGATILGTGSVWGDIYADLTEYAGIEAEGTPGAPVRLLFNRPTQDQGITECVPVFDEDGKFTFLFTEVMDGDAPAAFIHLNAVKAPWGFPEGISSCTITKFNAIPKDPSGIEVVESVDSAVIYNIYGQRVDENYRGIVIMNGKKYINR